MLKNIQNKNSFYFEIEVTKEQIKFTNNLVDFSISNHPVKDIFAGDPGGKERQREFRFTGTLGEVVFADAYDLPRPEKSFGAIDGQDHGKDFVMMVDGVPKSFDIKSMGRKNNNFRTNYVLNIPAYQMLKDGVITDYYFCISLHNINGKYIASFLGYVLKEELIKGNIGILYVAGTKRVKDDRTTFIFQRDTYEVDFKDITSPMLSERIKNLPGFKIKNLLPAFK